MNANVISLIVASAAFISSVVSPIAVAIVNNRHAEKMYKLQQFDREQRKAINEFIEMLSVFVNDNDRVCNSDFEELRRIIGKMYLYIPSKQWEYLDIVSAYARSCQGFEKLKKGYPAFCKSLASRY